MKIHWTDQDVNFEKLSYQPAPDFECSRKEQADFFVQSAWKDQNQSVSVTYLLLYKTEIAGFITLTMDEIPLAPIERPTGVPFSKLPAMKIAQMAVQTKWHGHGFGQLMVSFAIAIANQVRGLVGCRYVTLDSKTDLVEWYRQQGFVKNERDQQERVVSLESAKIRLAKKEARLLALPVSMRLDLHALDL